MKLLVVVYVFVVLFLFAGYVQCVVKFVKCDFKPSYKAEIIYGAGLVSGLGGIIGWMDLGK
jgi:hypothetical protein